MSLAAARGARAACFAAEVHLATLARRCRPPCEPLDDLQQAVAR